MPIWYDATVVREKILEVMREKNLNKKQIGKASGLLQQNRAKVAFRTLEPFLRQLGVPISAFGKPITSERKKSRYENMGRVPVTYLVYDDARNRFKIGLSNTKSLRDRFDAICTSSSAPPKCVCVLQGNVETQLHDTFNFCRAHREWFDNNIHLGLMAEQLCFDSPTKHWLRTLPHEDIPLPKGMSLASWKEVRSLADAPEVISWGHKN